MERTPEPPRPNRPSEKGLYYDFVQPLLELHTKYLQRVLNLQRRITHHSLESVNHILVALQSEGTTSYPVYGLRDLPVDLGRWTVG